MANNLLFGRLPASVLYNKDDFTFITVGAERLYERIHPITSVH